MSDARSSNGLGFTGALTILFIGLKLTGFVTWSWWWVLAPLWIGAVLVTAFFFIAVLIGLAQLQRRRP